MPRSRKAWLLEVVFVLALVGCAFLLRAQNYDSTRRFHLAEIFYAQDYDGVLLGPSPPLNAYTAQPYFYFIFLARELYGPLGIGFIAGNRLFVAAVAAFSCAVFYAFLRRRFSGRIAKAGAALFAFLPAFVFDSSRGTAFHEVYTLLFIAAFLFLWEALRARGRWLAFLVAGFAAYFKLVFLYFLVPFLAAEFVFGRWRPSARDCALFSAVLLASGGILAAVPAVSRWDEMAGRLMLPVGEYAAWNAREILAYRNFFSIPHLEDSHPYDAGAPVFLFEGAAARLPGISAPFFLASSALLAADLALALARGKGALAFLFLAQAALIVFVPFSLPDAAHFLVILPAFVLLLMEAASGRFAAPVLAAYCLLGTAEYKREEIGWDVSRFATDARVGGYMSKNSAFDGRSPAIVGLGSLEAYGPRAKQRGAVVLVHESASGALSLDTAPASGAGILLFARIWPEETWKGIGARRYMDAVSADPAFREIFSEAQADGQREFAVFWNTNPAGA